MSEEYEDFITNFEIIFIPASRLHQSFRARSSRSSNSPDEDDIPSSSVEISLSNLSRRISDAITRYQEYAIYLNDELPKRILKLIQELGSADYHGGARPNQISESQLAEKSGLPIIELMLLASKNPREYRGLIAERLHQLGLIQEASDIPTNIVSNTPPTLWDSIGDEILTLMARTQLQAFSGLNDIASNMELMLESLSMTYLSTSALLL